MKTLKKVAITEVVEVEFMPRVMEFGKLYHSERFSSMSHLCLCGCGVECYLPIGPEGWTLTVTNGKPTITPSILQRFECKSHYIITHGVANFA